jgi:hypothetical protein
LDDKFVVNFKARANIDLIMGLTWASNKGKRMKKNRHLLLAFLLFIIVFTSPIYTSGQTDVPFDLKNLEGLERITLSVYSRAMLEQQGFTVSPCREKEIYDIYIQAKKRNQPIFVTTDAVLHTCHLFFDYLLRILEIERLYDRAVELTGRMIDLSQNQYKKAKDPYVQEAARLNIGFFSVAQKIFSPEYKPEFGLEELVNKELSHMEAHEGLEFRTLLAFIENPTIQNTPYAFEDFSQYVPRGHYTRNEKFEKYFKVMMWYGRIDFKLKPGQKEVSILHGKKMTLQALLITDALMRDPQTYKLWRMIYKPTVYFVGRTDDLFVDDYVKLIRETFSTEGPVDRYWNQEKLSAFVYKAQKLRPPKILSGAAFVENGEFSAAAKGFRFMGQRFIPDSYMFQELVYGRKGDKVFLRYMGHGQPFTLEMLPGAGLVRAFPRGLDIMAVLGSKRALEILQQEGDTEYTEYYEQLSKLKEEFSSLEPEEWKQNLYWRWLHSLLPLLENVYDQNVPQPMKNIAWVDKELQAALGSWSELRHDTILYAKQSYTMLTAAAPPPSVLTYGYVEPYPEVYKRIREMMTDLRENLVDLEISIPGIPEKIQSFERILDKLAAISEKEREGTELDKEEYEFIWNIGSTLSSLKQFPPHIMEKITSGTDERMDIIADVHTDINTKQVLEEGVGAPFDMYIVIQDSKGARLCRGGVFSYYEFKHPMDNRLTDEQWQQMGKERIRPDQPSWTTSFIVKF